MDYKISILANAKIENAFTAVSHEIEKWWGKVDNASPILYEEFSVFFGSTEWRFVISDHILNDKITWRCNKAEHYDGDRTDIRHEWLHTEVHWEFKDNKDGVEISLVHKGLTPELNCYDICEAGWNYFVGTSLKNYLESGTGSPYIAEGN
jgi:hypothetical protein